MRKTIASAIRKLAARIAEWIYPAEADTPLPPIVVNGGGGPGEEQNK